MTDNPYIKLFTSQFFTFYTTVVVLRNEFNCLFPFFFVQH